MVAEIPKWLSIFMILFISVFSIFWIYSTILEGNYLFTFLGVLMAGVMLSIIIYTLLKGKYPDFLRSK